MTTKQLGQGIVDDPIRSVHFFNGRLLTAEDLLQEQSANAKGRARLGRVIGSGIANGLEVEETIGVSTTSAPVVTVKPGIAINREGDTLALPKPVSLALVRPQPGSGNGNGIGFGTCIPPEEGAYVAGAGAYLLTILPVEINEGKAPVSGLGATDAACNTKYVAHGVQFRLLSISQSETQGVNQQHIRNRLAYRCFGALDPNLRDFTRNLLGPPVTSYGLIDELRPNRLYDCEVPLALFYWTSSGGLVFVDMWSVRRRVIAPDSAPRWSPLTGDRRAGEGEAMFMQFADHLNRLVLDGASPVSMRALDHFRWLPPVGIVPLANALWPRGFSELTFFDGITTRDPVHIEGARLAHLVRASWSYPAHDLQSDVMLWLYIVRENMEAVADSPVSTSPQPYMVFASGHLPFWGDPHHDVNRLSFTNAI